MKCTNLVSCVPATSGKSKHVIDHEQSFVTCLQTFLRIQIELQGSTNQSLFGQSTLS